MGGALVLFVAARNGVGYSTTSRVLIHMKRNLYGIHALARGLQAWPARALRRDLLSGLTGAAIRILSLDRS